MQTRIMVLDGGLHHRKAFAFCKPAQLVPVHKVRELPLGAFDIIVVPFHTDQAILSNIESKLKRFVSRGGVLILLGVTEESGRTWVPFCEWELPYTEDLEMVGRDSKDGNTIFRGISEKSQLRYHGTYYAHGAILQLTGDDGADKILAVSENDRAVMAIRRSGFRGSLFCTTLDPDFHAVASVPGRSKAETEMTRRNAHKLVRNILDWGKDEVESKSVALRFGNRSLAKVLRTKQVITYIALLLLPALCIIYVLSVPFDQENLPIILASVPAAAGSIASIVQGWKQWKTEHEERR